MTSAQLLALVALGAFHGLHPGMGWLLAVARGLQEGGRGAVLRALPPIAVGHAGSVAVAAVAITVTGSVTASVLFPVVGGGLIVVVGLVMLLWRRHAHRLELRLPPWQLAAWSFVMASAHGSGLMLMPVLAGNTSHDMDAGGGHGGHGVAAPATVAGAAPEAGPGAWGLWDATLTGLLAAGVHTAAMLAACAVAALVAHDFLGVHALRWKGVTMDRVWAVTLLSGGVLVLWSVL
ncbi:cell wall anchor protein [Nocardiopsis lambiniae]|uniref:Cell wall anchor protein n=1 Tax=Nocardiopsis lambiniae TaxID=3075539 RepID=A0ABU2MBB2_9ACTN|nr:cell wall anchor protein [Nocardiopsis sp. DSM 44743]MDT0329969.1 cell wall anchor protein [Nocardiopsis sp. DSM 44743]